MIAKPGGESEPGEKVINCFTGSIPLLQTESRPGGKAGSTEESLVSKGASLFLSSNITRALQSFIQHRSRGMQFNRDLPGMSVLTRTFRVLVALTLLLSVNASLVQYVCGATGETLITSTLAVETTGTDTAPCGVISDGVHERLCGESQPSPVCDGDACTTDTVETSSVVQIEAFPLQIAPLFVPAVSRVERSPASRRIPTSLGARGTELNPVEFYPLSVRLRTLSFRL